MNWSLGYSARYYMTAVDWSTMKDLTIVDESNRRNIEIVGGSIRRSPTDLRESATVDCVGYDDSTEQIIRIWLDTKQDGESSHTALFTGLASCPTDKYNGRYKTNTLECYSLLKVASDILLPRGWYAPVEANSGAVINDLLSVLNLPKDMIHIDENTPELKQSIIASEGETRLSMVDNILNAMGNWRLRLDGYGAVYIEPIPTEESSVFDSIENDVIETNIEISYDWFNVPNVLRVTLDESFAEARDEDPNSPLSIQNRGREVWLEDTDVQLSMNETLGEYALRMLKYYQRISTSISYTRRFDPDVYPGDIVRIDYPVQNIHGRFLVMDQSITLGYSAKTSEEVVNL